MRETSPFRRYPTDFFSCHTLYLSDVSTYPFVFRCLSVSLARRRQNRIQWNIQDFRDQTHCPARRTPRIVVEINSHFSMGKIDLYNVNSEFGWKSIKPQDRKRRHYTYIYIYISNSLIIFFSYIYKYTDNIPLLHRDLFMT